MGRQVEVLIPGDAEKHRQRRAGYLDAPEARPMGKRPALSALHKSGQEIPVDVALSPLTVSGEPGEESMRAQMLCSRERTTTCTKPKKPDAIG